MIMLSNKIRPNDINICSGLSDVEGRQKYYKFKANGYNTFNKNNADNVKEELGMDYIVATTKVLRLTTILKNNNINKFFEFLNIDVEGNELNVLKSLDFNLFQPTLICLELQDSKNFDLYNIKKSNIDKLLRSKNYSLISKNKSAYFYLKKN